MEDRETRFRTDIARLLSICEDCKYLKVSNYADETLQIELLNPSDKLSDVELSFSFSIRDYPEGTVLSRISKAEAGSTQPPIITETKSILNLVATECYEFCKANSLLAPCFVEQFLKDTVRGKVTPAFATQVSQATSVYTETEGSDAEDYDNYDGFDDLAEGTNKVLELEMARVHQIFGENSLESREFAGIDEVDLLFFIDMNNLLDRHTASGWGVNLETPLVILLHVQSSSKYLDGVEPQVEVFQESFKVPGEKRRAGVGLQMKKIVERFIARHWKELNNSRMEEILATSKQSSPYLQVKQAGPVGIQRQASLGAQISLEHEYYKSEYSLENGFLSMVFRYVLNRILSLNEYCVICDEKHVLETGLIKPCVCTRDLCVFAFQTLGVMADAAESIAADASVVDLLIAMANAAACSPRNTVILDPYPSIVDPDNLHKLALDPNSMDFPLVKNVLADIVSYRQQIVKGKPMDEISRNHNLSFPLMQWIIATCRAHIVLLPEDRRLKSMETKYQFLLISSPPRKEAAFKNAKEKFGSQFAFHGSSIENWHSILRKGLVNASGSKLQLHGAAHGSGVYLSPSSNVSFNYSGHNGSQGRHSKTEDDCLVAKFNLRCVALCEVVSTGKLKKHGNIWVMPDSEHVCTRFFFVYDSYIKGLPVETHTSSFRKEIDHAMAYISNLKQK